MTLLVVGGTSSVGRALVPMALRRGPVRVTTRTPGSEAARRLGEAGAEIVNADLRDRASLTRAVRGATEVVACAGAFPETPGNDIEAVDRAGHRNLIGAARSAGVTRFLYVSAVGASPHHLLDRFRVRYEIEQALEHSDLEWTVIRPTVLMEAVAARVAGPLRAGKRVTIAGQGDNPINFVSGRDVARLAVSLLDDLGAVREIVELGGPENLSLREVTHRAGVVVGVTPKVRDVSPRSLRLRAATTGRLSPARRRQLATDLVLDTWPMTFEPGASPDRWPLVLTSFDDVVRAT